MKYNPIFSLKNNLQLLAFGILTSSSIAQVTFDVEVDNGFANYEITGAAPDAHIFTIYGDGTFSSLSDPDHQFADLGYTSKTYVVNSYDPIIPPIFIADIPPGPIDETEVFVNPEIHFEGAINILTSWATAEGFENYFILAFENASSLTPLEGNISFHFKESNLTINYADILVYDWVGPINTDNSDWGSPSVDKMIHWNFSDLEYGEKRFLYIPATVNLLAGESLITKAKYTTTNARKVMTKESQKEFLVRRFPHDPNFKIANKTCIKPIDEAQKLEYRIGFFNDGTGFANDVFVYDDLPLELDPTTLSIIDSEYPYVFDVTGSLLSIAFNDINLPGTNQVTPMTYSYDQASSYITFGICTVPNISIGSDITNEATIVFDAQPPFITDPSILYAEQSCLTADFCSSSSSIVITNGKESYHDITLSTYPNPVSDKLQIQLDLELLEKSNATCIIYDTMGKVVKTKEFVLNKGEMIDRSINVNNLNPGIYILTISSGSKMYSSKFIKQ